MTNERLNSRSSHTIFVFGSNRQGRHGKGAALSARTLFGAKYGQAEGLQGQSYAIVTKELRLNYSPVTLAEIKIGVDKFLGFAANHPEMAFYVTPIGCGLAGFTPNQIAPLFRSITQNVSLCDEFRLILQNIRTLPGSDSH